MYTIQQIKTIIKNKYIFYIKQKKLNKKQYSKKKFFLIINIINN